MEKNKVDLNVEGKAKPRDVLINFYNGHLTKYLAAEANLVNLEDRDRDEVIGEKQVPMGEKMGITKVKVKDAIEENEEAMENHKRSLKAITKLLEKYESEEITF